MKNSQKGSIVPVILIIIALLMIGGVYVYKTKKTELPILVDTGTQQANTQTQPVQNTKNPIAPSMSCGDFAAISDYVLKNITQPDSKNTMQMNKYVITSFHWKRSSSEPFVSYPIINGVQAHYGGENQTNHTGNIISTIKNDSDIIGKIIGEKAKNLGLIADSLNTLPFQSFPDHGFYLRTFAFKKGENLYNIILEAFSGPQALPRGVVTITCGKAINQYDKVYNALNLKTDTTIQDTYNFDYVAIADVSPDNRVFALQGGKIEGYYYFDGNTATLASKDSYPTECKPLESQKIGRGMRCADGYNQRTVTY